LSLPGLIPLETVQTYLAHLLLLQMHQCWKWAPEVCFARHQRRKESIRHKDQKAESPGIATRVDIALVARHTVKKTQRAVPDGSCFLFD
jgi:hypothetical protein